MIKQAFQFIAATSLWAVVVYLSYLRSHPFRTVLATVAAVWLTGWLM